MNWNPQQQTFFEWVERGSGSANLVARAGCGKSSTLVESARRIKSGWAFLGAFNRAIAEELKAKVEAPINGQRSRAQVGTLHSAGFRLWRQYRPSSEINARKLSNLAKEIHRFDRKAAQVVADAVSFAKQAGVGIDQAQGCGVAPGDAAYGTEAEWTAIFDHYDLWDDMPEGLGPQRVTADCQKVMRQSLEMCENHDAVIDYDDMIYAPLRYADRRIGMYDWVMIDEAQDTSDARRMLAVHMLKQGGRFVAVGDNFQSIYGFSGARNGAMDVIKGQMQSVELPLTITYRCPKAVVAYANQWVPDLVAHETAPEGLITDLDHKQLWSQPFRTTDAILCRFTRPLIGVAQRLREIGVPCHVEGSNARGLVALACRWGDDITVDQMLGRLDEWVAGECEKWGKKGREDKVEGVVERAGMLKDMAAKVPAGATVNKLVQKIEDLFSGEGRRDGLTLCTVHRSKGREWDRVWWLGPEQYQPAWFAKQEWEQEQERNLQYVAVTRVKKELVRVAVRKKQGREEPEWWEV